MFPSGIPEIIADYAATYELTPDAQSHQDDIDDWFEGFANNSHGCDYLLKFIRTFGHELCITRAKTMWEWLLDNPCAGDIFDAYPDKFQINDVKKLHPWSERLMRARLHELTDWSNISHMPEMVDILRENQDKIILTELVKNPNALDLIKPRMDHIRKNMNAFDTLCIQSWSHCLFDEYNIYNVSILFLLNFNATDLIEQFIIDENLRIKTRNDSIIEDGFELEDEYRDERGVDSVDWSYVNDGGNMTLLYRYPEKIDIDRLPNGSTPKAIQYIRDHLLDLSENGWDNINCNPAMINILIENPTKINRQYGLKHLRRVRFVDFHDCDWECVSDIEEIFETRRSEEMLAALYNL